MTADTQQKEQPEGRPCPLDPRYTVYVDGTVTGPRGYPLKHISNGKYNYQSVNLGRAARHYVHRLVALTFIGDGTGLEVDHIDGDTTNNHLSNLRYMTHAENLAAQRERKPNCRRGHPFAGNEYWHGGRRTCRVCLRLSEERRPPRVKRGAA